VWFTLSAVSAATSSARAQGGAPATGAANREALEQSVRQRFGEVVRRRLALSDEQMQKLQATNRKFESRRVELVRRERAQRIDLRAQMAAGDSANQSRVAELLDGVLASERERLDITAAEQKELATFLTPLQRARYLELQNQLRRRVDDMRRQRELRQRGDSSLPPPRRAPALRP
jgi:hypothetical protein